MSFEISMCTEQTNIILQMCVRSACRESIDTATGVFHDLLILNCEEDEPIKCSAVGKRSGRSCPASCEGAGGGRAETPRLFPK
jgi:hypothetical protein